MKESLGPACAGKSGVKRSPRRPVRVVREVRGSLFLDLTAGSPSEPPAHLPPERGRIVTPFSPSPPINAPCAILNATVSGPVALRNLIAAVERIDPLTVSGRVAAVNGLLIEARGGLTRLAVGARAEIERRAEQPLPAEVVGFRDARALLMPFGPVEGVSPGAEIRILSDAAGVRPTMGWLGRIVAAFGNPIDGKGPLPMGLANYPLRASPPSAHARG